MDATPPRPVLTLHTLGECRLTVERGDGPPITLAPDADRLFALALLLAGECGRPLPRGQAAEWVWPEAVPSAARRRLRQALYRLRAAGVPVAADADHLCLPRAAVAPTFAAAPHATALRAGWAARSLRLGRCLPGWTPPGDALRSWLEAYRDRIEGAARRALAAALADALAGPRALARAGVAEGAPDPGPPPDVLARALLTLDPAHPTARRLAGPRVRAAVVREGVGYGYGPGSAVDPRAQYATAESLGVLDARLAAARAGAGGLVVVAGPPGPGPSLLLDAFADRATGARVVYLDAAPWAVGPRASGAGLPLAVARALVAAASEVDVGALPKPSDAVLPPTVLGRVGAAVAAAGPVVVCLDHAECAGADALAAVAAAAATWGAVPALLVVACAGEWPASPWREGSRRGWAGRAGGPAEGAYGGAYGGACGGAGACGSAARRWGARLAEVARAVADGRPLLVRVDAAADAADA